MELKRFKKELAEEQKALNNGFDENFRLKEKKKKLKVTFSDGTSYCFSSALETFIKSLQKIGAENFKKIKMECCHLPLLTSHLTMAYKPYEKYIYHIQQGWYALIQSDTATKYIQLQSISNQLDLGLIIETGENLSIINQTEIKKSRKVTPKISVTFEDGTIICEDNAKDTFVESLKRIDLRLLLRKEFYFKGHKIVTYSKFSNNQINIDNLWVTIPGSVEDKIKCLNSIRLQFRLNFSVKNVAESTPQQKTEKLVFYEDPICENIDKKQDSPKEIDSTKREHFEENAVAEQIKIYSQIYESNTFVPTGKKIKVIFPDGTTIIEQSSEKTYMQALKHIGIRRLLSLNIVLDDKPFVTSFLWNNYEEIELGKYVKLGLSVRKMTEILEIIFKELDINGLIELV